MFYGHANKAQVLLLTALSDPRANPTRQIYKPRYARRAFGLPRFARNKLNVVISLV